MKVQLKTLVAARSKTTTDSSGAWISQSTGPGSYSEFYILLIKVSHTSYPLQWTLSLVK